MQNRLIDAGQTIGRQGSSASNLNNVIQDLLLSRRGRNRNVRRLLDFSDLSNDACTLIEQDHDLLIGVVYLLSAGRKSTFGS